MDVSFEPRQALWKVSPGACLERDETEYRRTRLMFPLKQSVVGCVFQSHGVFDCFSRSRRTDWLPGPFATKDLC